MAVDGKRSNSSSLHYNYQHCESSRWHLVIYPTGDFQTKRKRKQEKTFEVLKRWKRLLSIWKGSLCSNGIVYLIHDCALTWKHKSSQIQWTVKDENKIEKSFKKWKSLSDLKKYFRSFDSLLLWSLAQSSLLIRISSLENGFRALIFNKLRTN